MVEGQQYDSSKKNRLNTKLRSRRQLGYLKGLRKEIEEVSEKHGLDAEIMVEMIDELFVDMRKLMTSPKMPVIILNSFGVFKPSVKKITFYLKKFIHTLRHFYEKPDELSLEKYEKYTQLKNKFNRYWAVKQRYTAEKRGVRTWYCWRDLPEDLTGYQECHKPNSHNCHNEDTLKEEDYWKKRYEERK